MRTIKLTTGAEVPLDGDLLTRPRKPVPRDDRQARARAARSRTRSRRSRTVIGQMTDDERRHYLSESLFLNFVSYENQRLGALLKKLPKEV